MFLLSQLCSALTQETPVVLVSVIGQEGSTPRTAGTRMLVGSQGILAGTIGGGLMEAQALESAIASLRSGRKTVLEFDMTGDLANGTDFICGGKMRVLTRRILPTPQNQAFYNDLQTLLAQGETCAVLGSLAPMAEQILLRRTQELPALPADLKQPVETALASKNRTPRLFELGDDTWLLETWDALSPLIIAGGGHVSQPTAHMASLVQFAVTVIDDRQQFISKERFPEAMYLAVKPEFARCFEDLPVTPETSLVIVTRGHKYDLTVLEQALRTPAGYIGMIGSHRKRDALFDHLEKQGFSRDDFARVHSPIGLSIGAETPEEIAVSIVAELIQARTKRVTQYKTSNEPAKA